jgi:probable HAF family extracellular repeat protein
MKLTRSSVGQRPDYRRLFTSTTLWLLFAVLSSSQALAQALKVVQVAPPAAVNTYPNGVNKSNIVVGDFTNSSGATVGFAYLGGTKFKTFSAPKSNNFTRILGINDSNVVVGDFFGTDNFYHGFVIKNNGTKYTQYDVAKGSASTSIFAINKAGNFAGATGSGGPNQGFVNISGKVTTFYGSGTDNTFALGMNNSNLVVGQYYDSSNNSHGFSRNASGVITEIIFPGALQTACTGLNDAGEITGWYEDSAFTFHGFTDIGGQFQTNDFIFTAGVSSTGAYVGYYYGPGSANCNTVTGTSCYGYLATPQSDTLSTVQVPNAQNTSIYAVNTANAMAGYYTDSTGTIHGLLLSFNTVTNIDDPKAQPQTTTCSGINTSGQIVGSYTTSANTEEGFLYTNGAFSDIGVPNALSTYAYGINDAGVITGTYYDASNVEHGFVFDNNTYTTIDVPGETNAVVWSINANGLMTVDWTDAHGLFEASLYNGSKFTTLAIPGALDNFAHTINTSGNIAMGWYDFYGQEHGAFLKNGTYYIFDDPNGTSVRADGLNDGNLIVGRFLLNSNGQFAGFQGTIP